MNKRIIGGFYMKMTIKPSGLMDEKGKHLSSLEHRLIRIPFELRDINQISVNNFINLKSRDNEIITLKVEISKMEKIFRMMK